MRLIDADATIKYLREFRCKDCDRRKGMKNGKVRFCYEIGEAPCRACDIGDTIDYFLDEDISPIIDVVPIVRCKDCKLLSSPPGSVMFCEHIHKFVDADWFCADGEKR